MADQDTTALTPTTAAALARYVREAKQFRTWLAGRGLTVRDVSRGDVKAYRAELVARGLASATIVYKLPIVRRLLDACTQLSHRVYRCVWLFGLIVVVGVSLTAGGRRVQAQSLPAPWNVPWNAPGAAIPFPSASSGPPSYCTPQARQLQTDEDAQVVAAGWWLSSSYVSGGGVTIVIASGDYGGMCQPADNRGFVFVDGVFAGTLAPFGTGGAEGTPLVKVTSRDFLWASFGRLRSGDPFCCPSGETLVSYSISSVSGYPVLQVTNVQQATVTYSR